MNRNGGLHKAKMAKNDEFYTQLKNVEEELQYYTEQLKGKIVYCNCDNPERSNFYRYFYDNYSALGLAGLIASCHSSEKNGIEEAIWAEYDGQTEEIHEFYGDGDFRSDESIELLKRADIIVTNPPFSLFREYVAQLMDYDKQFIILGSLHGFTNYFVKELFMKRKFHITYARSTTTFIQKDGSEKEIGNICWYSNIDVKKHLTNRIVMKEKYTPEAYPKYDNYDAINVNKLKDIPYDYDGPMGVPVTFVMRDGQEQFEVIDIINLRSTMDIINGINDGKYKCKVNGKARFHRIIIRNKRQGEK